MKDFLKRIKADFLLSSVLCIIMGIVFVVWSEEAITAMVSWRVSSTSLGTPVVLTATLGFASSFLPNKLQF